MAAPMSTTKATLIACAAVGSVVALAVTLVVLNDSPAAPRPGQSSADAPATSRPVPGPSLARQWVSTARGTIDETTLEQYYAQAPAGISNELERDGKNRNAVWTFTDGSRVVATFRPRGDDGSGQDLVLYMVDVKE